MRILWTTLYTPHPTRGGGWSHSWELLTRASRRHEITLLCAGFEPGQDPAELAGLAVEAQGVSWRPHVAAGRLGLVWEALRGPGSEQFRSVMPAVRALADQLVAAQRARPYDLVFVWGAELAPLLDVAEPPTAYYVTDANTTYVRRLLRAAPTVRHRLLYALDAAHVRRWERTRYRRATRLATTSSTEAAVLEGLTRRYLDVVPIAVGDEWFVAPEVPRNRDLVTIIAGLDYWPNVDGIRWFVQESWPRIKDSMPSARLRVVGRSPVPELRVTLERAGIELIADVPDARVHYWQASVAVVPLRVGSGVKNKVIHAFACGAPVVATTVATEGIAAVNGSHLLVADDAEGLADAVLDILSGPDEGARRAGAARALAEPYRGERAAEALESFWQRSRADVSEATRDPV